MTDFLLTWPSGHDVPVPVYYARTAAGHPSATYDRAEALRFPTKAAAERKWLDMHRFPEDYEGYLHTGEVKAEAVNQPELLIS